MKLGDGLEVRIATSEPESTAEFLATLGFERIEEGSDPGLTMVDGSNVYRLVPGDFPSPVLCFFTREFESVAQKAQDELGSEVQIEAGDRLVLTDPNGVSVIVERGGAPEVPRRSSPFPSGQFGEIAISTDDLEESRSFWMRLGFDELVHQDQPYPWGVLSDGRCVVGLHQTNEWDRPALTYFSPEMKRVIRDLKQTGLETVFEMAGADGEVGNAGVCAPGGQMIFLFEGDLSEGETEGVS